MANKKPLRISDEANDIYPVEFKDGDQIDVDGIVNSNGTLTFQDTSTGPHTLTDLLSSQNSQLGKVTQTLFFGAGNVGDKWLALGALSKTTDQTPYVITHDAKCVAIAWSNSFATPDVTIEVYKNGTAPGNLMGSIPVVNKKTIAKTDITPMQFSHGDRLSIYLRKNNAAANDAVVHIYFQITGVTSSEVST